LGGWVKRILSKEPAPPTNSQAGSTEQEDSQERESSVIRRPSLPNNIGQVYTTRERSRSEGEGGLLIIESPFLH